MEDYRHFHKKDSFALRYRMRKVRLFIGVLVVFFTLSFFVSEYYWNPESDFSRDSGDAEIAALESKSLEENFSQGDDTLKNCLPEDISMTFGTRSNVIESFFYSLSRKGIGRGEIFEIARYSGLTAEELSRFFPEKNPFKKGSIYEYFLLRLELATVKEQNQLEILVSSGDEAYILAHMGSSVTNKIFDGFPLLSYVLFKSAKTNSDALGILLSQGISATLFDVALAIENNLESVLVIELINSLDIEQHDLLVDEFTLNSISLLAAEKFESEILRVWLTKTNSFDMDINLINELDLMPIPSELEIKNALASVAVLFDFGRRINSYSTFKQMASWIPESWLRMRGGFIPFLEGKLNEGANFRSKELVEILSKIANKNKSRIESNVLCQKETILRKSLDKKIQIFNTRLANLERRETLLHGLVKSKLNPDQLYLRNEIIRNTIEKKWDVVLDLLSKIAGFEIEQKILNAVMEHALKVNAPLNFVHKLLALGANIPIDAIHFLATGGFIELASELEYFGLDIHMVNSLGMNAISSLILNEKYGFEVDKNYMLKFLIQKGVSFKGTLGDLDALNYALMNIRKSNVSIIYARTLIDSGIEINHEHIEQMRRIKLIDSARYSKITEIIPELNNLDEFNTD